MGHALIVSMDVADKDRAEFEGWLLSSFLCPPEGSGLTIDPVCFRGLRLETPFRSYQPSPSYIAIFEFSGEPSEVVSSEPYADWWTEGVTQRFGWIQKQHWIVAELVTGPSSPFDHDRALITQVHLASIHQDGWARWYDEVHIPQSQRVPGLFRPENRRFSAVDLTAPRWHCAARPRFTHLVPIQEGADIVKAASTPEYLTLMADTQARWAGVIESANSTICERFR